MNQCKDNTNCFSWRIIVCTSNKRVQVGVFPTASGAGWKHFYQNTTNLPWAGDRDWSCGKSPTAFSTFCAQAVNGKPRHRNSAPVVHYIATSRNGRSGASSANCGSICYDGTTTFAAFSGSGKVSTDRPPRLPWAGKKTGKNPTDRGKLGVKRSVLTDGRGVPLGVAIAGANAHDQKLFHATLDSVSVRRPRPTSRRPQHLCCDKGFDADTIRREARRRRYTPHIKSRGEEMIAKRTHGRRARRWVVERIASWINRFRRILIRWEKKSINYLAMLHLAFAYTTWRQTLVLG